MRATKNNRTGRFQFIHRDIDGKRTQFSGTKDFPAGLTQKKADQIATEINDMMDSQIKKSKIPSLRECVFAMLEDKENKKRIKAETDKDVRTLDASMKRLRDHAERALEWDDNGSIEDIITVSNRMCKDMIKRINPETGKRYKGSYIIKLIDTYTQTFGYATDEAILKVHLLGRFAKPSPSKPRESVFSEQDITDLLTECDDYTKGFISFHLLTGIRTREFQDLEKESFRVISEKGVNVSIVIIDGKNGKKRIVPLSADALKAINGFEFPLKTNEDQRRKMFRKARDASGIDPDLRIHDLRHTFVTRLRETGIALDVIAELAGHSNTTMTSRYAHTGLDLLIGTSDLMSIPSR